MPPLRARPLGLPDYLVVRPDDWKTLLERIPHRRRYWVWRIFGIPPHAYWSEATDAIFVEQGWETPERDGEGRVAHEYGHRLGRGHFRFFSRGFWRDVMGYVFRDEDRYGLRPYAVTILAYGPNKRVEFRGGRVYLVPLDGAKGPHEEGPRLEGTSRRRETEELAPGAEAPGRGLLR